MCNKVPQHKPTLIDCSKFKSSIRRLAIYSFVDDIIGVSEIYTNIMTLANEAAPGPDDIIFEMLKHGSNVLLPLLSYVFELVMRGSDAPDEDSIDARRLS